MIQDIEAFMDPTSGLGYGSSFHGLDALVVSFIMDPWLSHKYVIDPWEKAERRRISRAGKRNWLRRKRAISGTVREEVAARRVSLLEQRRLWDRATELQRRAPGMTKAAITRRRFEKRAITKSASYARKVTRAGTWGFMLYGLLEIGSALATPGVNTIAARNDQEMFANERPLDSAAAYTQRQRALMAIHDSQLSLKGVIGQEAQFLHR